MKKLIDILHRIALFWAGVPPDVATMLLAVAHQPGMLVFVVVWLLEGLLQDAVSKLLLIPVLMYIWRKIPGRYQRLLVDLLGRFFPYDGDEDG